MALPADCSTEAGCRSLAAELVAREPALHVVVNNAGNNWGTPFDTYPASALDRCFSLNVKGVFHLTRACMPLLEAASNPGDPARVINIGSIDGLQAPLLETYAYSATKAALLHMTRVLAHRFAPKVTVNAVAPGPPTGYVTRSQAHRDCGPGDLAVRGRGGGLRGPPHRPAERRAVQLAGQLLVSVAGR